MPKPTKLTPSRTLGSPFLLPGFAPIFFYQMSFNYM
ncbi:hypothetical protein PDIG_19190 [Penicillium digitatum PHI26]|uniref:Uncharacterized protein n=2 Tax=Penicillium digitatum TaxID=36651 RepID=K9G429_PEND2|nr:hypothetical protein PDIP_01420 [Penicillium digitatum Pd1]EKV16730.1 hypothetical protein PDIG_19190 [Penicillium digitatum PHI26]EKV21917.1 hypothetical protein PDIP_01420 [Penicillium digitatum Pd1]